MEQTNSIINGATKICEGVIETILFSIEPQEPTRQHEESATPTVQPEVDDTILQRKPNCVDGRQESSNTTYTSSPHQIESLEPSSSHISDQIALAARHQPAQHEESTATT